MLLLDSPPSAVCSRAIACISSTSRCGRWMPCPSFTSLPNRRMLSLRCSDMPAFSACSTGSSGGPALIDRSDCTLELFRRNVGARSATASVMHGHPECHPSRTPTAAFACECWTGSRADRTFRGAVAQPGADSAQHDAGPSGSRARPAQHR